ncbi:PLP-dependent aminotransferase family protein [Candidatus Sumerlaeota bacterium]|nr:PLP-dependent aminotransferase family protein [Candidatus Sumerlaeota bacterium]
MSSPVAMQFPLSARSARTTDSPISWLMKLAVEDPEILSLAAGFVDTKTLPNDLTRGAINRLFDKGDDAKNALQYGLTAGLKDLRLALAARLEKQGIPDVDPDCIVISNGGQQGLYTITEVLCDVGDVVLVEDPTYFVYMDVLKSAGAHTLGINTDEEGVIPSALEERFEELHREGLRDRLRILYVMSYYANPKGSNMSTERRRQIYDIYQRELQRGTPFVLIEDASYRDLCLEGKDEPFLKSFDPENEFVFTTGTFSKAFAPGFRLGWSYMPPDLHRAMCRQKGNQDFGSSNMNQTILADLLRSGDYDTAAERFRDRYRAKRDALLAAMKEFWPSDVELVYPYGGLYVWAKLPGVNTDPGSDFFNACLEQKVIYVPGYYCFCDKTQDPKPVDTMRICYGVIDIDPMREAVRRMGAVIERFRKKR